MFRLAFALALVLTILASHPASADAPTAPTLTGEMFFTTSPEDVSPFVTRCDQSGTSSFTYMVRGPATGPYPGTFWETGTVIMGPHFTEITPFGPLIHAQVTSWQAEFQIISAAGMVRGMKEYSGSPVGFARCVEGPPAVLAGTSTDHVAFGAPLRYEARIQSVRGVFWDRGMSSAHPSQCSCDGPIGFSRYASFLELYVSDLTAATRGRGGLRP